MPPTHVEYKKGGGGEDVLRRKGEMRGGTMRRHSITIVLVVFPFAEDKPFSCLRLAACGSCATFGSSPTGPFVPLTPPVTGTRASTPNRTAASWVEAATAITHIRPNMTSTERKRWKFSCGVGKSCSERWRHKQPRTVDSVGDSTSRGGHGDCVGGGAGVGESRCIQLKGEGGRESLNMAEVSAAHAAPLR